MNRMCTTPFQIRTASLEDSSGISKLSDQLGYPSSTVAIKERLESILSLDDHVIFVAFLTGPKIIGWIHAYKRQSVESGPFAEIGGFIVAKKFRGKGVGRLLLKAIENWALQMRLPILRVRSQIQRGDAKQFYTNMGFTITKIQNVFDKTELNEA